MEYCLLQSRYSKSYSQALNQFWTQYSKRYTQLLRDSYAFSAHQQYRLGLLDQAQYQLATSLLRHQRPQDIHVYRFDIYGYDSTDILLIEQEGHNAGLLYIPAHLSPSYLIVMSANSKSYLKA